MRDGIATQQEMRLHIKILKNNRLINLGQAHDKYHPPKCTEKNRLEVVCCDLGPQGHKSKAEELWGTITKYKTALKALEERLEAKETKKAKEDKTP